MRINESYPQVNVNYIKTMNKFFTHSQVVIRGHISSAKMNMHFSNVLAVSTRQIHTAMAKNQCGKFEFILTFEVF